MNSNPHPTRSPEFLSRLHDGELSPAERAHFESHRSHCSECRTAAAQFEAALTLYRTSIPSPAAPDLAARILRKLQTNDSLGRKQRFGPTFGIDLRWAGAFAAAVIAAIIGSSIVAKNEARERLAANPAVPIALENRPAAPAPEFSASRPAAPPAPAARRLREEAAKTAALERDDRPRQSGAVVSREGERPDTGAVGRNAKLGAAANESAFAPQKTADSAQRTSENAGGTVDGLVAEKKRERAAAPAPQAAAAAPPQAVMKSIAESRADAAPSANDRIQDNSQNSQNAQNQNAQNTVRDADRPGGEGGNAADNRQAPALRLVVSALDGGPSAPDLLAPAGTDLPAGLRGQQFVVMVDAAGHVREVRPWPTVTSGRRSNEPASRAKDKETSSPLLLLRFQPGDSPRRLLVRVE